jgi:U4/U6.U5 tri-snRNP-associated protein 2
MPGCVGLNNLKLTDFANCVVQLLARVRPLRDFCLLEKTEFPSSSQSDPRAMLSLRFSELIKKLWNPFNFKGHVSPHEFMEAVSIASKKQFRSDDRMMK